MMIDSISNSDGFDESTNLNRVTTDEARDRLEGALFSTLRSRASTLINAPTALGKSHTTATMPWREYPEVTGGELVIHLHQTTDARDEAIQKSKDTAGVEYAVFKGREDRCPVAAGEYDDQITAPTGRTPSEWFEWMCDVRKNGFVTAHHKLEKYCDTPCTNDGPCEGITQWWQNLRDDDGNPTVDVVHTTANFAHVSKFIEGANLIFDERPDYALTLDDSDRQQMRDSVSNLLRHRSDGERSMPHLKTASLDDVTELKQELCTLLTEEELGQDWYFGWNETHQLAPAIGLAMLDGSR